VNPPFWQAILDSDFFGKCIVFLLFLASIYSTTLIVGKVCDLQRARRALRRLLSLFRQTSRAPFLITTKGNEALEPAAGIYRAGCRELTWQLQRSRAENALSRWQFEKIENALLNRADEDCSQLRRYLASLSTIAAAGPMAGLLGTVSGVLLAFQGMGEFGSATIAAVAPGISGALITTVFGLIVALPALIAFNLINKGLDNYRVELYRFAEVFMRAVETHYPVLEPLEAPRGGAEAE